MNDRIALRWDLLESQPPDGERLTARLAAPERCRDVYIAVDRASRRYVLISIPKGESSSLTERTSRGIGVRTLQVNVDRDSELSDFVEVACLEAAGHAALDIVALELVEALVAGASIGRVRLVQSVLAKWRRFWAGVAQNLLSREAQLGLFGELWFMSRWLIPSIGIQSAVTMWRGPAGARNDYEGSDIAIEVKTTARIDDCHQIHGLEQLLEPSGGALLLFSLSVREEASGLESLPGLVLELRKVLAADQSELERFESLLLAAGYEHAHEPEYGKLKLRVRGQRLYRISEGFPRLVPDTLKAGVPAGVSNVSYDLRLEAAAPWLIGTGQLETAKLLKDFCATGVVGG